MRPAPFCYRGFNRRIDDIKHEERLMLLEFGERLDLVLWETCHIYATCQAYRAEADFQHSLSAKELNMLAQMA